VPRTRGSRDADHEAKRLALLERLIDRLAMPDATRPSLRQLAESASVTEPTLRHYFGNREGIVAAAFAEWRRRGDAWLPVAARPSGPLAQSLSDYLAMLIAAFRHFGFAKIVAVGFIEGLLDVKQGPLFLRDALDPMIDALAERLAAHQQAGEMRAGDPRFAAVALAAPVILMCQHQLQLHGEAHSPTDIDAFVADHLAAFLRAHAIAQDSILQHE
jgi:AcrR family transcriptional regulator